IACPLRLDRIADPLEHDNLRQAGVVYAAAPGCSWSLAVMEFPPVGHVDGSGPDRADSGTPAQGDGVDWRRSQPWAGSLAHRSPKAPRPMPGTAALPYGRQATRKGGPFTASLPEHGV